MNLRKLKKMKQSIHEEIIDDFDKEDREEFYKLLDKNLVNLKIIKAEEEARLIKKHQHYHFSEGIPLSGE
jgi:3-methyladenine DNA glycosylase AlkD